MHTNLDRMIIALLERIPDWREILPAEDVELVEQRLAGASLRKIAEASQLTPPGVRVRLYGEGYGGNRSGGVLGRLRTCLRRELR